MNLLNILIIIYSLYLKSKKLCYVLLDKMCKSESRNRVIWYICDTSTTIVTSAVRLKLISNLLKTSKYRWVCTMRVTLVFLIFVRTLAVIFLTHQIYLEYRISHFKEVYISWNMSKITPFIKHEKNNVIENLHKNYIIIYPYIYIVIFLK